MKKFSLKSWMDKIQLVALRFPFSLFFVMGLAIYFFLKINRHPFDEKSQVWAFFSLGIPMSIALTLLLENIKNRYFQIGINVLSIILLIIYTYSFPDKFQVVHICQVIVLCLVFSLSAFFVSFFKKDTDIPFWEFSKTTWLQLLISGIFAQVLMLGLSLAVLSLKELFKIDVQHEVYENLAVICYLIFTPIYFLANVPDRTEKRKLKYTFPTFIKILGLYILLPILVLYSIILYVYLLQIVVKWELPNGWVSILVSVLGLGGFLCMLILFPLRLDEKEKNKIVNLFSSYFSIVLIPLLALMSVGIFRRLGDYGLTINRCYVLILNVWLYGICIYLFISKANHLKWIIISFAAVALLSSVGPWSVYNVTERKLSREIGALLTESKLLKNGKVIDNSKGIIKIDSIASQKLSEDIHYICDNYGSISIQTYFNDSIKDLTSWKIQSKLGVYSNEYSYERNHKSNYFNVKLPSNKRQALNVSGYTKLLRLKKVENSDIVFSDNEFTVSYKNSWMFISKKGDKQPFLSISLKNKFKNLSVLKVRNSVITDFSLSGNNFFLTINSASGLERLESNEMIINEFDIDLLLK